MVKVLNSSVAREPHRAKETSIFLSFQPFISVHSLFAPFRRLSRGADSSTVKAATSSRRPSIRSVVRAAGRIPTAWISQHFMSFLEYLR